MHDAWQLLLAASVDGGGLGGIFRRVVRLDRSPAASSARERREEKGGGGVGGVRWTEEGEE